jgi:hypothetical protein
MINPFLYRVACASCGGLSVLPLDILQTKILSNETIQFNPEEFKWLIFMPSVFALQNTVYNWAYFIPNQVIRGSLAGLVASPPYIFLEIKKLYSRMHILPKYKNYIFWMTIRELVVYITLYNLILLNIPYIKFFAAFIANGLGFPLRIIALKSSYPNIIINIENIKKTALLEIVKSAIGDGIALFLIYNFYLSPIKIK